MIQVLYTNIQSKIKINGFVSKQFTLMREIHQVCLLSILLYIISAKVLAVFTDASTRIKRVQVRDYQKKILNFADDTTIFYRDIKYLTRIQSILKLWEKSSSSKINFSKTHTLSAAAGA